MYYRRKLLLSILEKTRKKNLGKLNFQKVLFLICQIQEKPLFDFIPYKYGCFSFQANKDMTLLSDFYHLLENEKNKWVLKKTNINYFDQLKAKDQSIILKIFKEENIHSTSYLISRVYQSYPYMAINIKRNLDAEEKKLVDDAKMKIDSKSEETLFSIGYENRSIDEYLNLLIENNISLLCDVRRNPVSMKYGFSKKTLEGYCNDLNKEYIHIPELGIDRQLRNNLVNKKSYEELFSRYKKNVLKKKDKFDLIHTTFKENKRIALTCFENDHHFCHRSTLSNAMESYYGLKVEHL